MSSASYLSRLSKTVLNTLKQVKDPFEAAAAPATLFDCTRSRECLSNWRVASDAVFGGCSRGEVAWTSDAPSNDPPADISGSAGDARGAAASATSSDDHHGTRQTRDRAGGSTSGTEVTALSAGNDTPFMRFSGVYSKRIDPTRAHPNLKKSGFVSISGKPLDSLGEYIDLECYKALRYTIRVHAHSLHRTFLANVRSDNWVTGGQAEDVWQAVLHDGRVGRENDGYDGWRTVEIPLESCVLTWRGKVVEERAEMGKSKVVSIGMGILGHDTEVEEEGPFCLDVRRIEAVP